MNLPLMLKMLSTVAKSKKADKDICMIGHRGYSSRYPDNTEISFIKAAENGSGGAETDVRITKDGVFVTNHNSEVTFIDGTQLEVADHTYAELTAKPLRNTKSKDTVYLCTFERYLEIMKENNMICFIELKGSYTEEQVKEVFATAARVYDLSKCIMQSFDFDNLIRAHELLPDLPLMLTYGSAESGYERCFDYGFSIDVCFDTVSEKMVKEFHDRGLEVAVWTCNNPLTLNYSKALGVDYIESDVYGGKK